MIKHSIAPKEIDLGEMMVRRLLPVVGYKSVGPFVFFDHFGPKNFAPGEGMNVRPHPHIGLSTVTYLYAGVITHRDSLGVVQDIKPGDLNLMVSGKGICHSERTPDGARASGHESHGLQLWLALPARDEDCEPAFHHYPGSDIPLHQDDGCEVKVLIGSAFGLDSPVLTHCPTLYLDCRLAAGASLTLPDDVDELAVYTIEGELQAGAETVQARHLALLDTGKTTRLSAVQDCHFVVVGGEPQGKRFLYWNFVATTSAKIEQAKQDWQQGRFAGIAGETEFIPLPDD